MGKGTPLSDEQKGMIRKLYLEQGWGYGRIGSHLRMKPDTVMNYLKKTDLIEKKKTGTWGPQDVLLPSEAVHQAIERERKKEQNALKSASRKGSELAERVVAEVLTREQMAKEALLKITGQADMLAARIAKAVEHMEEYQVNGRETLDKEGNVVMVPAGTNMRDLKDLTAAFVNLARGTRELAGEKDGPAGKPDKHMPVRIGVIGNVRISAGGVEVESQPQSGQNGRSEPVELTVDAD